MPPHRLLTTLLVLPCLIHGLLMRIPSIQTRAETKSLDASFNPAHISHSVNSQPEAEEQTPEFSIDINQGLDPTTASIVAALKANEPHVPFEYHYIEV